MQHDYYRVLGIDPNASFETIRDAYRQRAMECHPD
jgi:curved DNA-binding protein CbpA